MIQFWSNQFGHLKTQFLTSVTNWQKNVDMYDSDQSQFYNVISFSNSRVENQNTLGSKMLKHKYGYTQPLIYTS